MHVCSYSRNDDNEVDAAAQAVQLMLLVFLRWPAAGS
jgi:hypothetical protein